MFKLPSPLHWLYNQSPSGLKDVFASSYALWSGRTKYGGDFDRWFAFLARSQWWNGDQLRNFQGEQLGELLRFASNNCPFYARRFAQHGLDLKGDPFEAIKRLPILTKDDVRQHHRQIATSASRSRWLLMSTSGTTGTSLHVPWTKQALQREYAFRWVFNSVAGARRGDSFAYFTGHSLLPVDAGRPPYYVRNSAEDATMFSLYHMSDATMPAYVEALARFRPQFIAGYPSGIYVLARFAQRSGIELWSPTAIFTASEMLHDPQRQEIENAFRAPVFQWYGQVECTVNLHECEQHRLHVKEEYGLLEFLNEDGTDARPGELATAVGTGWGNLAFPLIRYRTGDKMILAKEPRCPCGRGGRLVERISGRDEDLIVTPDNRYIGRLDFVFKPIDTVRESQIVQLDRERIVVKVVPMPGHDGRADAQIVKLLQERIGNEMRIAIEHVREIPRDRSGKFRYVVSRL